MTDKNVVKEYDKLDLPFSSEAEKAVLGAIITDSGVLGEVANILPDSKYYYVNTHRNICAAVFDLYFNGETIDFVTLFERLKKNKHYDESVVKAYLLDLIQNCPAASSAAEYAKIVHEKYILRRFIKALRDTIRDASEGTKDIRYLMDELEQRTNDIRKDTVKPLEPVSEALIKELTRLGELDRKSDDRLRPIPTGFKDLDKVLMGLTSSDLILLAARPGMGKTAFALNIAGNIAAKSKKAVAFFSLEMTTKQLVSRLLSVEAMVDGYKLYKGELSDEEWTRIVRAGDMISNCDIYIDDTPRITVAEIKSKLKQLKNIDFVVVDYLQLMTSGNADKYAHEVSEITKSLKSHAEELSIPVMCLSQLNRSVDMRNDHRPVISDMEASAINLQDADIILFLYREGYYADRNDAQIDHNSTECIVAKNNHGKTATVRLNWQGEYTRFDSKE